MDVIYIAVSAPWKMEMELFVPWLMVKRGAGQWQTVKSAWEMH